MYPLVCSKIHKTSNEMVFLEKHQKIPYFNRKKKQKIIEKITAKKNSPY